MKLIRMIYIVKHIDRVKHIIHSIEYIHYFNAECRDAITKYNNFEVNSSAHAKAIKIHAMRELTNKKPTDKNNTNYFS